VARKIVIRVVICFPIQIIKSTADQRMQALKGFQRGGLGIGDRGGSE
jgi:hypothetical protein